MFLNAITADAPILVAKFGLSWGCLLVVVCATKAIRTAMTNPASQYLIVTFVKLFFNQVKNLSIKRMGF